jgi:hypothetical protein
MAQKVIDVGILHQTEVFYVSTQWGTRISS